MIVKRQKGRRREILEEFFLALILQNENPKKELEKSNDILNKYEFETPSIGKIFKELISVKDAKKFDIKSVSKNSIKRALASV